MVCRSCPATFSVSSTTTAVADASTKLAPLLLLDAANELIDASMRTYRNSVDEDFYSILPIDLVPNEEEVIGMYPAIDTAIAKCTKVIVNHSMPSNDRPARKKAEHNRWIDENWITVGIASYYRRDYEGAMKNFNFVHKFYSNDPSLYVGELWMAKNI